MTPFVARHARRAHNMTKLRGIERLISARRTMSDEGYARKADRD